MSRRAFTHDYSRPGIYHITIHVADGMGQPLGAVVGTSADSAAITLTRAGETIKHELTTAITAHYPMITVDEYVIMPNHLHFILIVRDPILTQTGRHAHLGQVIAGFKTGCNRAYWAATGQEPTLAAKPTGPLSPVLTLTAKPTGTMSQAPTGPALHAADSVSGGSAAKKSRYSTGRPPLFAPGYCDVQPIEPGQLATQRAYIKNNPRSRWLRSHKRDWLAPQRGAIVTALTPTALRGFLQRECAPHQAEPEALAAIEHRLLLAGGVIVCDSYGNRALLTERHCLPVICHRKDAARFAEQKARCLEEAAQGAVLVSACISPKEREIINECAHRGFDTILIADNGFPERYHPSTDRLDHCAAGSLLLVSPWIYQYRGKNEAITVPFCKTMNCVAQALCRTKDNWWKA